MSKLETNFRQSIIIKTLRKKPATFEEILEVLSNEHDYDLECSIRTFQRDVKDIASFYDVEINYNRSLKVYEITDDQMGTHEERLIETFDLLNALNYTEKYTQELYLENRKPIGTENLHGLLHAIKNKVEIKFSHQKYWEGFEEPTTRTVQPLAIKEARYRWYLIAKDHRDNEIKTFGLDRITDLDITRTRFTPPESYSPEQAFKYCFGIVGDATKPERVVLSFSVEQGKYVKSLPLHSTQRELISNDKEYRIELYVHPTYDFVMELLSLGNQVKVLEPESLKNTIKERLQEAIANYN